MLTVRVRLLRVGAQLPLRGTEFSSGLDVFACLEGGPVEVTQTPVVIPTGIAMEVPFGFDAQLRPRSGLARKGVLSTFGTLDADYRGELMITMYTVAPEIRHTIEHGDRISQLVIAALAPVTFDLAEELSPTQRGAGGHGSTGR